MLVQLGRILVMEALHHRFLDGAVHALDPTVGPRVGRFGQAVLHAVFAANEVETVAAWQALVWLGVNCTPLSVSTVCTLYGNLSSTCRRNSAATTRLARGELGKGHLAGSVDGHEQILAAFFSLHLGKIDVEVTDGMVLEFLFRRALLSSFSGKRLIPRR